MSNRTLIEINHDFAPSLRLPLFLEALANYVRSADSRSREELEKYGVRVFGMRHHSEGFSIQWGDHAKTISENTSCR
jgi:hypothetical protein